MEALSELLVVNLSQETKQKLRLEAARRRTNMSQLVRQMVESLPNSLVSQPNEKVDLLEGERE